MTIRHNRAVGGDGNTAGTFVDAGIGGGLANNGSNPFVRRFRRQHGHPPG